MRTAYTDLNIRLSMDGHSIQALNLIIERFDRMIPSHSHGNGCYEIHYISAGYGILQTNGQEYKITPGTLFVTGPHIEHAQTPILSDPMQEYCVYLKLGRNQSGQQPSTIIDAFTATPFWFGQDTQGLDMLMKQLFDELKHQYTGYMNQVELLLGQLLIYLVRNYEQKSNSQTHFAHSNLSDSKSIIIEDYFLYEYPTLSLETLADRLKLSTRQTQRLLKEHYGKSFQQKKAEARMSAAGMLLRDKEQSITSIAEALGYSSTEHFSSAFRQYYNMSPREYRRSIQSEEETE